LAARELARVLLLQTRKSQALDPFMDIISYSQGNAWGMFAIGTIELADAQPQADVVEHGVPR